ncbi:MAG: adenine phosphoribosyltransferase [Crocinitomicaceae bacterium]|nr:adenine phosphoribosyltransferase [Crocinitomicaceae bacterium]|tara:strand:+ start:15247 stop:15780 length:534 start_codon:yes stop_codon:yes gene_type:complete
MTSIENKIKDVIRDIPDFPKQGILFKDITPIMMDPILSNDILNELFEKYKSEKINAVAGIESRGFLFGYPLAMKLNVPFVLIRKKGKLPYKKISFEYELEYGYEKIEMHSDSLNSGDKVLIHDDLLATGGSAQAAASLIKKTGAEVYGFDFLISLDFLGGKKKISQFSSKISNLVAY